MHRSRALKALELDPTSVVCALRLGSSTSWAPESCWPSYSRLKATVTRQRQSAHAQYVTAKSTWEDFLTRARYEKLTYNFFENSGLSAINLPLRRLTRVLHTLELEAELDAESFDGVSSGLMASEISALILSSSSSPTSSFVRNSSVGCQGLYPCLCGPSFRELHQGDRKKNSACSFVCL